MTRYFIILTAFMSLLGTYTNTYAVEGTLQPISEQVPQATYEDTAKALAGKIKVGFIETSMAPSITSCIAQGTKKYAGFATQQEQDQADSITEYYLLMGKNENLDLTNKDAVYNFLVKKFAERIGQNVEKGAGFFGGVISMAGQCVSYGANEFYKLRLKQAIDWAFEH